MSTKLADLLKANRPALAAPRVPRLDELVTIREAARICAMNANVLRRWVRERRVRSFRLGGSRNRVRVCDILRPVEPVEPKPKGGPKHGR